MEEKREVIKALIEKGYNCSEICREVKKFGINKMLVYRTYNRYIKTGDVKIKKKTGRPRTVRTAKLIKQVDESLRENCARSARELAKSYGVSRRVMERILKEDLKLHPIKRRKEHDISETENVCESKKNVSKGWTPIPLEDMHAAILLWQKCLEEAQKTKPENIE